MLIAALLIGAILPIAVALATIYLGVPRSSGAGLSSALALAKGLALGIVAGLVVSAVVLAGVFGAGRLIGP